MSTKNILTDEHHRQIIQAERDLDDAIAIIDGLEKCDTDCQQIREVINATRNRLANLRHQFLPKARKG